MDESDHNDTGLCHQTQNNNTKKKKKSHNLKQSATKNKSKLQYEGKVSTNGIYLHNCNCLFK